MFTSPGLQGVALNLFLSCQVFSSYSELAFLSHKITISKGSGPACRSRTVVGKFLIAWEGSLEQSGQSRKSLFASVVEHSPSACKL